MSSARGFLPAGATMKDNLALIGRYSTGRLTPDDIGKIKSDALQKVGAIEPILMHILDVTVKHDGGRNYINLTVRSDYLTMLNHYRYGTTYYCFFLSEKLEPYVIITAVDATCVERGKSKLRTLTAAQVDNLCDAIAKFKAQHDISGESYHYTPQHKRQETEALVKGGAIPHGQRAHSGHFHLKMRVDTAMMTRLLPVCSLFNLAALAQRAEPISYQFSGRHTLSWEEALRAIRAEIEPAEDEAAGGEASAAASAAAGAATAPH